MARKIACPACKGNLDVHGEVKAVGFVHSSADPEGKARADLILECESCNSRWNAFVALEDFFRNPIAEGC